MPWPIRHIQQPRLGPRVPCRCSPDCEGFTRSLEPAPKIGDAWYHRESGDDYSSLGAALSRHYLTTHKDRRPPIVVILPDGYHFCVDSAYYRSGGPDPDL